MLQARGTKKQNEKSIYILAVVKENHLPEAVHISCHFTNEGRVILPKLKKSFKGIYFSVVSWGKVAGSEQRCLTEL